MSRSIVACHVALSNLCPYGTDCDGQCYLEGAACAAFNKAVDACMDMEPLSDSVLHFEAALNQFLKGGLDDVSDANTGTAENADSR